MRLERHYISPLTQVSPFVELLKMELTGRPVITQIANPESWRYSSLKKGYSRQESFRMLSHIERYLTDTRSVFAHDKGIELGSSFPYFEWVEKTAKSSHSIERKSFIHYLGNYQFFYLYGQKESKNRGEGESFSQLYNELKALGKESLLTLLGGSVTEEIEHFQLPHIPEQYLPFLERIDRQRGITSLFNGTLELLIINPDGKYIRGLTRNELQKNLTQIITETVENT